MKNYPCKKKNFLIKKFKLVFFFPFKARLMVRISLSNFDVSSNI